VEVSVFGAALTAGAPADWDLGAGVTVASVEGPRDGTLRVRLQVAPDAGVGARDLIAFGSVLEDAIVVHDGVDRIVVTPGTGMARIGGENFPKGFQAFDAIGYDNGPDGRPDTDDDLELGRVDAAWHVEEYATTFGDEDIDYVGTLRQDGTFVPAADGPNPDRVGNRNNIGDVWVVATHRNAAGTEIRARGHLIVTVPLYMRFEPWREVDPRRTLGAGS
jgi:quinohemoprotein amine dehydrogenase